MRSLDELLNKLTPAQRAWLTIGPEKHDWTIERIARQVRQNTGEDVDIASVERYLLRAGLPAQHADSTVNIKPIHKANTENPGRHLSSLELLLNKLTPAQKAWLTIGPQKHNWTIERTARHVRQNTGEVVDISGLERYLIQAGLPARHADPEGPTIPIQTKNGKNEQRSQVHPSRVLQGEKARWAELASNQAREIRDFLSGRKENRPADQQICEWIQFCYTFELYLEGRELFVLVNSDEIHPWLWERTKRLASICELKANSHE